MGYHSLICPPLSPASSIFPLLLHHPIISPFLKEDFDPTTLVSTPVLCSSQQNSLDKLCIPLQSGLHTHHPTEATLHKPTTNDNRAKWIPRLPLTILPSYYKCHLTQLTLLKAFFFIWHPVLSWFSSCHTGQAFSVSSLTSQLLKFGITHSSILRPVLFSVFLHFLDNLF